MMIKRHNGAAPDEPYFDISGEALLLVNNCLNEALHGFHTPDLEDVLGMSLRDAEGLLERVNKNVDSGKPVVVSGRELAAAARCVRLAVAELGPEFPSGPVCRSN